VESRVGRRPFGEERLAILAGTGLLRVTIEGRVFIDRGEGLDARERRP
jgi:hypothetical protein